MHGEEWRPVVGYEGAYEVSNAGQFRRVAGGQGARAGRAVSNRRRNAKGYAVIELCVGDAKRRFLAHQLVGRAFLGAPPTSGHCINHRDGVKTNNVAGNLEWCTRAENTAHAAATGLLRPLRGEANGRAKLTAAQVNEIRGLRGKDGQRQIASRYGVARSLVQRIHQGRAWSSPEKLIADVTGKGGRRG